MSILSSDSNNIQFRGLVNLLVLILLTYTIRALITSLEKHDLILFKEVAVFMDSGVLTDPANYQTFAGFLMLSSFAILAYWIELLASKKWVNRKLVSIAINKDSLDLRINRWKYLVSDGISNFRQLCCLIQPTIGSVPDYIGNRPNPEASQFPSRYA